MRVYFNTPSATLQGGPPTHLPLLENELRNLVEIVPFQYGRKSDTESFAAKFIGRLADLLRLHRQLKQCRPDLIHHNSAFDAVAFLRDAPLALLAKHHNVPLFIKFHGSFRKSFGPMNLVHATCRQIILKDSAAMGVLSVAEREEFISQWPWVERKLSVVKNVINDELFSVKRRESRSGSILFVSRFFRKKGMFDLLDAIPQVLTIFPDTVFIFIGGGEASNQFNHDVDQKGLRKSVQWFDHMENEKIHSFYVSAWALVFASHLPEGMPMVVAEAMAAGVPVITTPTRFARSYLNEPDNCLFTEVGSSSSIAEKIVYLMRQPKLRSAMSGRNQVLASKFRQAQVAEEFHSLYQQLVG